MVVVFIVNYNEALVLVEERIAQQDMPLEALRVLPQQGLHVFVLLRRKGAALGRDGGRPVEQIDVTLVVRIVVHILEERVRLLNDNGQLGVAEVRHGPSGDRWIVCSMQQIERLILYGVENRKNEAGGQVR